MDSFIEMLDFTSGKITNLINEIENANTAHLNVMLQLRMVEILDPTSPQVFYEFESCVAIIVEDIRRHLTSRTYLNARDRYYDALFRLISTLSSRLRTESGKRLIRTLRIFVDTTRRAADRIMAPYLGFRKEEPISDQRREALWYDVLDAIDALTDENPQTDGADKKPASEDENGKQIIKRDKEYQLSEAMTKLETCEKDGEGYFKTSSLDIAWEILTDAKWQRRGWDAYGDDQTTPLSGDAIGSLSRAIRREAKKRGIGDFRDKRGGSIKNPKKGRKQAHRQKK